MVASAPASAGTKGVIRQVIGPVLDVEFPAGKLPKIYNALRIEGKNPAGDDVALTAEVQQLLGDHPRVHLTEPLDYDRLVAAIRGCTLLLTDSGGLQEEAPSLGKPVLVLRRTTERPEAVQAGTAKLIGTDAEVIEAEASTLLSNAAAYDAMARAHNPFGDGTASKQIEAACAEFLAA